MGIKRWHVAAFVVALVGVGTYAYVQHGAANALAARVAEETADANREHEAASSPCGSARFDGEGRGAGTNRGN